MKTLILRIILCLSVLMSPAACAVISQQVRSEAEPDVPFKTLLAEVEKYKGRTVILGGYILDINNQASETIIKVLQVPLKIGEDPDIKDSSEGRFLLYHQGFLDPEVYVKNRALTVAGKVIGADVEQVGDNRIQYLKIESREIYLWPEYEKLPGPYPPWSYPYYRYGYPYYGYPYYYW
jgi:outer membrane lipoprotein